MKHSCESIREYCLAIYRERLRLPELAADADVVTAGCDSTTAVLLTLDLESEFKLEVSLNIFYEQSSAEAMAHHIAGRL